MWQLGLNKKEREKEKCFRPFSFQARYDITAEPIKRIVFFSKFWKFSFKNKNWTFFRDIFAAMSFNVKIPFASLFLVLAQSLEIRRIN